MHAPPQHIWENNSELAVIPSLSASNSNGRADRHVGSTAAAQFAARVENPKR